MPKDNLGQIESVDLCGKIMLAEENKGKEVRNRLKQLKSSDKKRKF
jgi:hypothetical protein